MSVSEDEFQQLFEQIRHLHNRLRWLADQVHRDDGLTAATRSLLLSLYRSGPQTVPDMARERLVSRQIIQTQINGLLEAGWVETRENPRHKRSVLIALTGKGDRLIQVSLGRESALAAQIGSPLSADELGRLNQGLECIRTHLESIDPSTMEG